MKTWLTAPVYLPEFNRSFNWAMCRNALCEHFGLPIPARPRAGPPTGPPTTSRTRHKLQTPAAGPYMPPPWRQGWLRRDAAVAKRRHRPARANCRPKTGGGNITADRDRKLKWFFPWSSAILPEVQIRERSTARVSENPRWIIFRFDDKLHPF